MLPAMFAMLVILGLAVAVLATVVLGMEGTGRRRLPEVSHTLARAGRHLNGEAAPPRGLVAFFDAAEDGADDLRHLPDALRRRSGSSARSAASARSASSAASVTPASAPTARSSATPAHPDAFAPRPFPDAPPPASAWGPAPGAGARPSAAPASAPQPAPGAPQPPAAPARNAWAVWAPDDRG